MILASYCNSTAQMTAALLTPLATLLRNQILTQNRTTLAVKGTSKIKSAILHLLYPQLLATCYKVLTGRPKLLWTFLQFCISNRLQCVLKLSPERVSPQE
ncbi:hypothetical protein CRM22_000946 [Opisthorchis felineus]|uniref:Uncharacterized protein n=1 Tax=Opisthorchis felineus TaxID=147828 RepID=A0A4S2MCS6_OPIFE|nr:hypothetical protein CRM22_000946 [Opisthorchis felineus]